MLYHIDLHKAVVLTIICVDDNDKAMASWLCGMKADSVIGEVIDSISCWIGRKRSRFSYKTI